MNLATVKATPYERRHRKRIGRGEASGHGKTSTRGHKGAGQHSAPAKDARFEGGQMPFYRRIPKRGFRNSTRKAYEPVNLVRLAGLAEAGKITPVEMRKAGLVNQNLPVKVLGNGEPGKALQVAAHAFSKSAKEKIEKAGGSIETLKW
jgi:large subunit ribosomal protein L15